MIITRGNTTHEHTPAHTYRDTEHRNRVKTAQPIGHNTRIILIHFERSSYWRKTTSSTTARKAGTVRTQTEKPCVGQRRKHKHRYAFRKQRAQNKCKCKTPNDSQQRAKDASKEQWTRRKTITKPKQSDTETKKQIGKPHGQSHATQRLFFMHFERSNYWRKTTGSTAHNTCTVKTQTETPCVGQRRKQKDWYACREQHRTKQKMQTPNDSQQLKGCEQWTMNQKKTERICTSAHTHEHTARQSTAPHMKAKKATNVKTKEQNRTQEWKKTCVPAPSD